MVILILYYVVPAVIIEKSSEVAPDSERAEYSTQQQKPSDIAVSLPQPPPNAGKYYSNLH